MPRTSKKPKKGEVVGEMRVYPEEVNGYRYWVADCRKKLIDPGNKRQRFKTKEEAKQFAAEQNEVYWRRKQSQSKPIPEIDRERYHMITDKVDQFRTREFKAGFIGRGGEVWDDWDVEKAVDVAHFVVRHIQKMNAHAKTNYSVNQMMKIFINEGNRVNREKSGTRFDTAINEFLQHKASQHGGKGRRQLRKSTVEEWNGKLGLLKEWIGSSIIKEREQLTEERKTILSNIDNQWDSRQGRKPALSPASKRKCAQKIKEFGAWLCDICGLCRANPFVDLPKQYDFVKDKGNILTFNNDEVRSIFKFVMQDAKLRKMIPYLAFSFFAGLRPNSEIAMPKGDNRRRFLWKQFTNKTWPQTGGFQIDMPAMIDDGNGMRPATKISTSRLAELSANGKAWIDWWATHVLKDSIPDGNEPLFFSERYLRKIHDIPKAWHPDGARHTFCSNALANWNTLGVAYWTERSGHSESVFRKHYGSPRAPEDAADYFAITPQSLIA